MLDKKVLIIKENHDDFEMFWSKHMAKENVWVYSPYKDANGLAHYLRAVFKKSGSHFLHGLWINEWKEKINRFDYIIVFDNCATEELLKWISNEIFHQKIILWLWNIPKNSIESLKKYATILCFDKRYAAENNVRYVHQFYFENLGSGQKCTKFDFSYVGSDKNRYNILKQLASYAMVKGLSYKIQLFSNNISHEIIDRFGIVRSNRKIAYESVLEMIGESKAILELNIERQAGLTLRALEALFFRKKLITNNASICEYDFYKPENIFVLQGDSVSGVVEFLKIPYIPVPKEIIQKYSYSDWLEEISNL